MVKNQTKKLERKENSHILQIIQKEIAGKIQQKKMEKISGCNIMKKGLKI